MNWTSQELQQRQNEMNARKKRAEQNLIEPPPKKTPAYKGRTPNKELQEAIYKESKKIDLFMLGLTSAGVPLPTPEHKFHDKRRWRFDYAWIEQKVALEVEGGVWTQGRHTRGKGFLGDMDKYNNAVLLGWKVVRVTPEKLKTKQTREMIKQLLKTT